MDRIDVLNEDYQVEEWLTTDLLSEAEDEELQSIVERAAKELKSPIALVSLILDKIQFFKAHTGLPEELKNSRGTLRNASFCQFVVKEGVTFEVNDGPGDPRIPQHVVKEFNIQAYLGVPIKLGDAIVGSLCVLDNEKRKYSDSDHQYLGELSKLVNRRLKNLAESRRQIRHNLTQNALPSIVKELHKAQLPIQENLKSTFSQLSNIRLFLNKLSHTLSSTTFESVVNRNELELAKASSSLLQDHLGEMEIDVWNSIDCLTALENLVTNLEQSYLRDILSSAQDISRNATDLVGGFKLAELKSDQIVHTNSRLATALISNCLLLLTKEMQDKNDDQGITLDLAQQAEEVALIFKANQLDKAAYETIFDQLYLYIGKDHPTISIDKNKDYLKLIFKTKATTDETT